MLEKLHSNLCGIVYGVFFCCTCGPRTVTGVVLCHEHFGNACYIRSIIGVFKWRGCSEARKNAWKISIRNPEVAKILPSISQRKCEDNIKWIWKLYGRRERRLDSYLDRDILRGFVYTVMNPRVWEKVGKPFVVVEPSSASV
jgi:hypothetical protein